MMTSLKQDGERKVCKGKEQQYSQKPGPNPRITVSKKQHTSPYTTPSTVNRVFFVEKWSTVWQELQDLIRSMKPSMFCDIAELVL